MNLLLIINILEFQKYGGDMLFVDCNGAAYLNISASDGGRISTTST